MRSQRTGTEITRRDCDPRNSGTITDHVLSWCALHIKLGKRKKNETNIYELWESLTLVDLFGALCAAFFIEKQKKMEFVSSIM